MSLSNRLGSESEQNPGLNSTRLLMINVLTIVLDQNNDNYREGLKFTSAQLAREIEEEIFRQNNFCESEQFRKKVRIIKKRLEGEQNNFIREMLKKGKISVKDFCSLDERDLMNNDYLKSLCSHNQERNIQNNDLFNFKNDIFNPNPIINLDNKDDNSKEKIKKEEEVENEIRDYLKCYICLCKVKNPCMCKYCKKLCCEDCIKKWLENHNFCMKCKKEINFENIIKLPFLDDMASYFIHNIDSHPKHKENQEKEKNEDKKNNENEEKQKICSIHGNKMEYYCVQCNNFFCSNCLLFFSEEVKKHEGHLILQESQINDLGIKDAIHEFNKLPDTKIVLDKIIKLCKDKIRENEIKRCQISNFIDLIKSLYIKKINEVTNELEKILINISAQRDSVEASIASIPNGFKNIVDNNDYAQGNIVFQELQKYNLIEENLEENIKSKSEINPTLFIENYETDFIEFVIPYGFQYQENMEILNKKLDIIPGFPSRLIIESFGSQVHTSFTIDIDLPLNTPNYPKFYSYFIVKNEKYGQDFANLVNQSFIQDYIQKKNKKKQKSQQKNSIEFDANNISFLYGKKSKIKLFIIKTYYK